MNFKIHKNIYIKIKVFFLLIFASLALMYACGPEGEEYFDEDLLIGKWRRNSNANGFEYYRYDDNNSGATWDTGDDVTEEEAQIFTWTLNKSNLTLIHETEMGAAIPKKYTINTLNTHSLVYHDDYDTYIFSKVEEIIPMDTNNIVKKTF